MPLVASGTLTVVMVSGGMTGGVTVTEALADLVRSATLVAVTVPVVVTLTAGAVNQPLVVTLPKEADHVTAVLLVFWTVAVNWYVPDEATVALVGTIETMTCGTG
jgi:hypothetical protein